MRGLFSSCGKWGPLFIAVCEPLIIAASLAAEHKLQTRRLSSCGSRAQPLHGTWDPPRPGLEPVSPASAGRFPTTAPPGKPHASIFNQHIFYILIGYIPVLTLSGRVYFSIYHLKLKKGISKEYCKINQPTKVH